MNSQDHLKHCTQLLDQVADIYQIDKKALLSSSRKEPLCMARAVYAWLADKACVPHGLAGLLIARTRTTMYKASMRGHDLSVTDIELRYELKKRNLL